MVAAATAAAGGGGGGGGGAQNECGGPEPGLPISELGNKLASDPTAGAQNVRAQTQSSGYRFRSPGMANKVVASDPNAGAHSAGAQNVGAQTSCLSLGNKKHGPGGARAQSL